MSGGTFEYSQYRIRDIWETIQSHLDSMGKEKPREELRFFDKEYLEKYPEERFYPTESKEVRKILQDAVKILKKAEIYAQRIDWYLSGDDGEESLIRRLKEDLESISKR